MTNKKKLVLLLVLVFVMAICLTSCYPQQAMSFFNNIIVKGGNWFAPGAWKDLINVLITGKFPF